MQSKRVKVERQVKDIDDRGFNCSRCGKWHKFGGYVAAHWDLSLTHTCECGQRHSLQSGVIEKL